MAFWEKRKTGNVTICFVRDGAAKIRLSRQDVTSKPSVILGDVPIFGIGVGVGIGVSVGVGVGVGVGVMVGVGVGVGVGFGPVQNSKDMSMDCPARRWASGHINSL